MTNHKPPKVEIFETKDGSSSLLLPEMNETYHSTHGAVTESKYVFLKMGLDYLLSQKPTKTSINILEIGFGTGLNVWLTAMAVKNKALHVKFTTFEKFPLATDIVAQLNYTSNSNEANQSLFKKIHEADWAVDVLVTTDFQLTKNHTDIFEVDWQPYSFDLIFFDAFAPSKQPEMWSLEILKNMYMTLNDGGVFITYCAQGQFKRDLKTAGFEVEVLEGPPGKKQMTRGVKRQAVVSS